MLWKNGLGKEEPLNPSILDTLSRSNPALIERYKQQMADKNAAINLQNLSKQWGITLTLRATF
jgi:hypothetical protein